MSLPDRYACIRHATLLREEESDSRAPAWTEQELQAFWFSGRFGRDFTTTDGRKIHIVQFGVWNHEAGPDFSDASVSINNAEPLRGNIELDPDARDWERHGHAQNPDYNGVVLHLFLSKGAPLFFTRTSAHRNVAQVQLDPHALDEPPAPQPEAKPGRCLGPLRTLPENRIRSILQAAAQYRLRQKSATLARISEIHGPDEALYQALAIALGYKSNKLPFTLLAQRLPLRKLRAAKKDTAALLFGIAGFLDQHDLSEFDLPTRAYLRSLWERWWPHRAKYQHLILPQNTWKMSAQRPANHPQRRLAALTQLVHNWPRIHALSLTCNPGDILHFFASLRDEYWDHHYTLTSRTAQKRMALIGENRTLEMLTNVFFPIAITRDPKHLHHFEKLPATGINLRVKIAAMRLFGENILAKKLLKSAAMQQGLLQIYEDFCQRDASDCKHCLFPSQLAHW